MVQKRSQNGQIRAGGSRGNYPALQPPSADTRLWGPLSQDAWRPNQASHPRSKADLGVLRLLFDHFWGPCLTIVGPCGYHFRQCLDFVCPFRDQWWTMFDQCWTTFGHDHFWIILDHFRTKWAKNGPKMVQHDQNGPKIVYSALHNRNLFVIQAFFCLRGGGNSRPVGSFEKKLPTGREFREKTPDRSGVSKKNSRPVGSFSWWLKKGF